MQDGRWPIHMVHLDRKLLLLFQEPKLQGTYYEQPRQRQVQTHPLKLEMRTQLFLAGLGISA